MKRFRWKGVLGDRTTSISFDRCAFRFTVCISMLAEPSFWNGERNWAI